MDKGFGLLVLSRQPLMDRPSESASDNAKAQREQAAALLKLAAENERKAKEEEAKDAVLQRIAEETLLAHATVTLLTAISAMTKGEGVTQQFGLAKFRQQLQPLAQSYGYKIVLVGDKTRATIVAV